MRCEYINYKIRLIITFEIFSYFLLILMLRSLFDHYSCRARVARIFECEQR